MKKIFIKLHGINDVVQFVQSASFVDGDIVVSRGSYTIDGKSLMGMLSIDVSQGFSVEFPEDAEKFDTFLQTFSS